MKGLVVMIRIVKKVKKMMMKRVKTIRIRINRMIIKNNKDLNNLNKINYNKQFNKV